MVAQLTRPRLYQYRFPPEFKFYESLNLNHRELTEQK